MSHSETGDSVSSDCSESSDDGDTSDIGRLLGRFSISADDNNRCLSALRGESVSPDRLCRDHHGEDTLRLATISGIRHHLALAESPDVEMLCNDIAHHADLARARHARLIMSNVIPDLSDRSVIPYCIWYPDVASEETYRQLALRYPTMRYHVGRACAVAGYVDLYRTLDLLPDVSIAEEARDNIDKSRDIFDKIVASPVRFAIMNDYTRTVSLEKPTPGAYLNGDTAVLSSLQIKFGFRDLHTIRRQYFDINEDRCIGESDIGDNQVEIRPDEIELLYSPLPLDLPTINKDLLILMAAYEGNIDRYSRLRRPHLLPEETSCIIRGIYHNTMFAKWWSYEIKIDQRLNEGKYYIGEAIIARFIMSNDLSWVNNELELELPYLIWYPLWPRRETLAELVRRRPEMRRQVAHACIVANYEELYDSLSIQPHRVLWEEAKNSPNRHFAEDLERRVEELGIDLQEDLDEYDKRQLATVRPDKDPTSACLYGSLFPDLMCWEEQTVGIYPWGSSATSKFVDIHVCSAAGLKEKIVTDDAGCISLHDGYPEDEALIYGIPKESTSVT